MFSMTDKRSWLILAAAMLTALCLACIRLGDRSLWLDEVATFHTAHQSIQNIVENPDKTGGAAYYLMMKIWLLFGDSEFWMRLFSALCFVFTVPVAYVIGRAMASCRAGLYAAWLTATAPFLIRYAQEARMYALLFLFGSLALMCVALILARQTAQGPAVIGTGLRDLWRRPAMGTFIQARDDLLWLTYIITVVGGMLSHNTALLLPVVTTLIFLAAIATAPGFRRRRLWNLILANLVVLALYAFNLAVLLTNLNTFMSWHSYTVPPWWTRIILLTAYVNEHVHNQGIAMVALSLVALWVWLRRREWRWLGFALIGTIALPLMLFILNNHILYRPTFFPRTIIWAVIPFYVACAFGISRLPWASLRCIVLAGLLLANLYGVLIGYDINEPFMGPFDEPWDRVAGIVAEGASNDSAVVICPSYAVPAFNYYWRRHEREMPTRFSRATEHVSPLQTPASGLVSKWRWAGESRSPLSLFDDYSEVWMIVENRGGCDPAVLDALASRGQLILERDFVRIKVLAYARTDQAHAE